MIDEGFVFFFKSSMGLYVQKRTIPIIYITSRYLV
jgi:hypothetical protein